MASTRLSVPYKYKSTLVVIGSGPFPFDMLRYDCCFPASSSDAEAMSLERSEQQRRAVRVMRYHDSQDPRWTVERWGSFGWVVMTEADAQALGLFGGSK